MNGLTFYKGYKNNEKLRKSFNNLATLVFGIDFEEWYQKGFWNDRYIPYSYVDGGKIIANVSINLMDFVIKGEHKKAIQIGTVMTHPDYRNQGLAADLMNKVLVEYENHYDFIYLFANQTVLDFYPKFGFKQVDEAQYSIDFLPTKLTTGDIRKLDVSNKDDLQFVYDFARERIPVSSKLGTINSEHLLMYYCLYVFKNDIYYLEEDEVIIIYKTEAETLNIFDIVSKKEISIKRILSKISNMYTNKIIFHFTPQYRDLNSKSEEYRSTDFLFVKTWGTNYPSKLKHPFTSKA